MAHQRLLLRNGIVLTLDPQLGNFPQADVLIEGPRIAAIAPQLEAADAEEIDAGNMIVMPGFVDTHRHIWEGILRNIAADAPVSEYFSQILGVAAPVYRPQDAYIGNLVSALGAIDAGITTLLDWSHIQNTPEHSDAVIAALQESGLRAVFGYGPPNTALADWWFNSSLKHPHDIKRLATQYFSAHDQLLTLALAPRGPLFSTLEVSEHDWQLAREVGVRISVHVGGSQPGQPSSLEALGRLGLLGPDTTYIHCVGLNAIEWQMIAETGGTISISGPVEMQMGIGWPPIQQALDHGLRPSLSVDVETSMPGDLFTQMRAVFALQRAQIHARIQAGEEQVPPLLTTRDMLEFATTAGARACGLDHKVGTLVPGKAADMILLRTDRINVLPINDPIGAVVMGMDTGNVDTVIIAGRIMKRNGQLLNVDLNRVRSLAYESRDYVVAQSGLQRPALR